MSQKLDIKLVFSLFSIALFWGTTYLAMRIGVETIPPILVTGLRNLIAGGILLTYLTLNKQLESMTLSRIKQNIIISFMLIILGNGLTTFSEKYISSGLAALVASTIPLVVVLLNWALKHERFSSKMFLGIILALCGIYLIYQNSINDLFNPQYRIGFMAMLGAVFTWSFGTIYSKSRAIQVGNILMDLCFQMLFAGIFLSVIQLMIDPQIHVSTWIFRSIGAVFYLAIFGSILGYTSYIYALSKLPSTKVSVFNYVNVVVAVFLGWLILDEKVTLKMVFATVFILSGVIVTNYPKRSMKLIEDVG